jgi:nijmegen breakage syndrome protein 1
MPKCIWIIDGAYLFAGTPGKVDYLKLKQALERINETEFYESYFLSSSPDPATDSSNSFYTWLKSAPPRGPKMRVQLYQLKSMTVVCSECNTRFERQVQKGVDVGIATLLIKLAVENLYDRLILTAGDGDFEDAISYVKSSLHKEIWIAGFGNSLSVDLQSYADKVIWLDDIWEEIKMV